MKKILALVLALALVVCSAAALAAGSKQNGDIGPGGTVTNPVDETKESVSLVIIDNTEETQKVIDTFKEAFDNGDVLAALPEDIRAAIPEELTKINEMLTAKFEGDPENLEDDALLNVQFETPYEPAGDPVAFLFGKLVGEDKVEWTVEDKATIKDDGTIDILLKKDFIQDMIEAQPFILAVVSK